MGTLLVYLLLVSGISNIGAQKFTAESPYLPLRLMDVKLNEWKPEMLDKMEEILDSELKYSDTKKGIECKSIDFEQEAGYPIQDARFLDLSIRGLCKDYQGKVHTIDKLLMTVAFERHIEKINEVTSGSVYKIGNVQLFKRNRNILNLIIIPLSVGFTVLLCVVTFLLRYLRRSEKKKYMIAELEKKREASGKRIGTAPNPDPNAAEKQRLLINDTTVVGSASSTLGSPKEFTNDQYPSSSRAEPSGIDSGRNNQNSPTTASSNQGRRTPFNDDVKLLPSQCQPQYDASYKDMIPMQETQPRVVVRTVRGVEDQQSFQAPTVENFAKFVSIPVQVERSGASDNSYVPPYHSDPYYRSTNS